MFDLRINFVMKFFFFFNKYDLFGLTFLFLFVFQYFLFFSVFFSINCRWGLCDCVTYFCIKKFQYQKIFFFCHKSKNVLISLPHAHSRSKFIHISQIKNVALLCKKNREYKLLFQQKIMSQIQNWIIVVCITQMGGKTVILIRSFNSNCLLLVFFG